MIWTLFLYVTIYLSKSAVLGAPVESVNNVEEVRIEGKLINNYIYIYQG